MLHIIDWVALFIDVGVGLYLVNHQTNLSFGTKRLLNGAVAFLLCGWLLHSAGWLRPVADLALAR